MWHSLLVIAVACWMCELGSVVVAKAPGAGASTPQLRLHENNAQWRFPWLENMPAMDSAHSPDGREWTNSMAVCAVMKDENIDDVTEWLAYYRWLGVEHVFLTDNDSTNFAQMHAALQQRFSSDFLTLRSETMARAQLKVYAWCAETQREHFNWLAFFDVDEFLVLRGDAAPAAPGEPPELKEYMDAYKDTAGLSISWIWVGPSGQEQRPARGGVLSNYQQCLPKPDVHIKTIVNTWFLAGVAPHPHNFLFRENRSSQTESGFELSEVEWRPTAECRPPLSTITPEICTAEAAKDKPFSAFKACCFWMPAALNRQASVDSVALFHYATKSRADFEAKMQRGSGMSKSAKGTEYFENLARQQETAPICAEAAPAWPECCSPKALQGASPSESQSPRHRSWPLLW